MQKKIFEKLNIGKKIQNFYLSILYNLLGWSTKQVLSILNHIMKHIKKALMPGVYTIAVIPVDPDIDPTDPVQAVLLVLMTIGLLVGFIGEYLYPTPPGQRFDVAAHLEAGLDKPVRQKKDANIIVPKEPPKPPEPKEPKEPPPPLTGLRKVIVEVVEPWYTSLGIPVYLEALLWAAVGVFIIFVVLFIYDYIRSTLACKKPSTVEVKTIISDDLWRP